MDDTANGVLGCATVLAHVADLPEKTTASILLDCSPATCPMTGMGPQLASLAAGSAILARRCSETVGQRDRGGPS